MSSQFSCYPSSAFRCFLVCETRPSRIPRSCCKSAEIQMWPVTTFLVLINDFWDLKVRILVIIGCLGTEGYEFLGETGVLASLAPFSRRSLWIYFLLSLYTGWAADQLFGRLFWRSVL